MTKSLLRVRLLGGVDLQLGDRSLPPPGTRARSLLAYLLLHREVALPRPRVAFLFWPDTTEAQARTNLRHVLHGLRRTVPEFDRFVDVTPQTLQWRMEAPYWLDVAAFDQCASGADREPDDRAADLLRESAQLYRGDLLEGCYDTWLDGERDRVRRRYLSVLERLVRILEAQGERGEAIVQAERLLQRDPLREDVYRTLMRLHETRGDRASALRAFQACSAVLERELGVAPSAATLQAYDALVSAERERPDHTITLDSAAGGPPGTPLIGRAAEWTRVTREWREVERGSARLLLVSGEPGIGKTRLVEEFCRWCAGRGAVVAQARSYAAEGALAYAPLIDWLRSEPFGEPLDRLDRAHRTELARLLPEIIARTPEVSHPAVLPENEQRQRLFEAGASALRPAERPVVLVLDDIQWCDVETVRFVHYLLRALAATPLLVAATTRREELPRHHGLHELAATLRAADRVTELDLSRLTKEETADLARSVRSPASGTDFDALFDETEGNPLFIIEAMRAGWRPAGAARSLVPKVQAVIEARLARLSEPARDLAGVGAVLGRAFTIGVLERTSTLEPPMLSQYLDELWQAGIVRERGADALDFSHDRIREVAYHALGPASRRHHHLRAAEALKQLNAADTAAVSGRIAAHYEVAGVPTEAIGWYETAAAAAQRLYANADAVRALNRGLELLGTLPPAAEHQARELALITQLLWPLASTEGFASSRLQVAQARALALARLLGVDPPPALLRSLAIASLAREDFHAAQEIGEQLRARVHDVDDPMLRLETAYVQGVAAFWQGQLDLARRHFEAAVAADRARRHTEHLVRYGLDPRVICISRLGNTLCLQGEIEAARRARADALSLALDVGHAETHATSLVFAALMAIELEEFEKVREYVAAIERLRHDSVQSRISLAVLTAYVNVLEGGSRSGLERIRVALEEVRMAPHAPGMRGVFLRVLLSACDMAGDARGRLAAAEELLQIGGAAKIWEAEAHRIRAECLARLRAPAHEIEDTLARAIETARLQGATLFERRAAAMRRSATDAATSRQAAAQPAAAREFMPER